MPAAMITPTEDQTFDALFGWLARLFDLPNDTDRIVKGYQNLVAAPVDSYIVVSPGVKVRQDALRRRYDGAISQVVEEAHVTYRYQVDCYGQEGPSQASIIAVAWRSMWGVDNFQPPVFTPLYADEPEALPITNSEGQYEQRFMVRLHGQVNQVVRLPQDFFEEIELNSLIVADQLPY